MDEDKTKDITYTIKDNTVVINIYYKKNSYGYVVNYHFNNNLKDSSILLPPKTGLEGSASLAYVKYIFSFIGLVASQEIIRRKFFLDK